VLLTLVIENIFHNTIFVHSGQTFGVTLSPLALQRYNNRNPFVKCLAKKILVLAVYTTS
jgi:hypothetical protein